MNSWQVDLSQCCSSHRFKSNPPNPNSNSVEQEEQSSLDSLQKPLSEEVSKDKSSKRLPTELNPRWEEKRKLYHIKQRTLYRIYISKWWYVGLEWFEFELLILLGENLGKDIGFLSRVINAQREQFSGSRTVYLGGHSSNTMEIPEFRMSDPPVLAAYQTGEKLFAAMTVDADTNELLKTISEIGDDIYFELYNLTDFKSIWNLRSFQSLRDIIFVPFQARSVGKKGIKKTRIRGYTDGRGSAGDPKRTRLARQVDTVFWQDRFEKQWNETFTEIERIANASTDPY